MQELISYHEARDIVLQSVSRLGLEYVALSDALGRTLAADLQGREDLPPFDNSAMDGYAVRTVDLSADGIALRLAGEIAAGDSPTAVVEPGTCVRIMTGAPLPPGADAVVPIEVASEDDGFVHFRMVPQRGENVRRAGSDLKRGEKILSSGEVIGPSEISILASSGHGQVPVALIPRVAVLTTGNELVDVASELSPGKIRDSNGPSLAAQVVASGGRPDPLLRAPDDRVAIRAALSRAAEADVVVVSGGISVGAYDLVKEELDRAGMELLFWRVRQRPGKPLAFGLLDRKPVFGLPGNPVSSFVCFEQYVRPALAAMLGKTRVAPARMMGTLTAPVPKKAGLYHFARGLGSWTERGLEIEPAPHQGSHVATSLVRANGFIHLPEELDSAPAGMRVVFEPFAWNGIS